MLDFLKSMMMRCPYVCAEPIQTPVEKITDRIERCEDPARREYLEAVRCVYESDLSPVDMAVRLMEQKKQSLARLRERAII